MKIRRSLLKDTVQVETFTGSGAYGPGYAPARTVACNVDARRRLVRDTDGTEVVSEATLHVHPDDGVDTFTPGSRVTVNGRPGEVIDAKAHTMRGRVAVIEVTTT